MDIKLIDEDKFERDTRWLANRLHADIDDVRQVYYLSWLSLPHMHVVAAHRAVKQDIIDEFISRRWRHSYRGLVAHKPLETAFSVCVDSATEMFLQLQVSQLLDHLCPRDREVLELTLAGYTHQEIAEQCGRKRSSVSRQILRIRQHLREVYNVQTMENV